MQKLFTTQDALQVCGATRPQLSYLAATGTIRAVVEGRRGRGGSRLYSFRSLVEAAIAARLLECAVPVKVIRYVVESVRGVWLADASELTRKVLVIERGEHSEGFGPWAACAYLLPEDVPAWLKAGHSGIVIQLPALVAAIEQATSCSVIDAPDLAAHASAQF